MVSCLMVFSLSISPVFADELDQFLDSAEQSMQDSADSLRSKNSDQSVNHQSSAIRNLEKYLRPDQDQSAGDLQQDQQALRDRLKKLQEELAKRGIPGDQGEQSDQADGDGNGNGLDEADGAMGDAGSQLGEGNAEGAVESQGKALDALRDGAKKLAEAMQQQGDGEGDQAGDGPGNRTGRQQSGANQTDPLGRPMHAGRELDDLTQKIPGEIDVQRVRRILEELRRRLGDSGRSQTELDYIERLLKDY
jgi:exonuclease VII large subunit